MSNSQPYSDQARDEAINWFLHLQDELGGNLDNPQFQLWLMASPEHRSAFQAIEQQWQWIERFKQQNFPAKTEALLFRPEKTNKANRLRYKKWLNLSLAASIVMAIGLGLFSPQGLYGLSHTYRVEKGENKTIVLTDGSTIDLNTNSEVNVHFNHSLRKVELIRGEAFFTVQHNPLRPFNVHVANVTLRDIGTAFNVYQKADQVNVAVEEGIVEVKNQSSQSLVNAGQQAKIRNNEMIKVSAAEIDMTTAWRKGELIFRGSRLDEVLNEIGRYHDVQIQLTNKNLAALAVTGNFKTDQLDIMLNAVSNLLSVKIKKLSPNQIVIESS
ncbi:MAG: FecR family protein [Methylomonas sp.]